MKTFVCELCGGMLTQPTPMSPCAHVLCGACHTATVGSGFVECPACFKPIFKHPHTAAQPLGKEQADEAAEPSATALAATPLPAAGEVVWRGGAVDEAHGEALRRRLEAALRSIGSQQDRAEWKGLVLAAQTAQGAAIREEQQATRLILEFGTELPSGYTEAAPFCRIVEVRRGSAAAALPSSLRTLGQFVQGVAFRTLAAAAANSDDVGEAQKAARKQAGARAAPQRRHVVVVTWAEALQLPPLEIRFVPSLQSAPSTATLHAYDGGVARDLRRPETSSPASGRSQGSRSDTACTAATGQPASGSPGCCRRRLIVQLPLTASANGKSTEAQAATAAGVAVGAAGTMQTWVYDANGDTGTPAVSLPTSLQPADAVGAPQGVQMSSGWIVADSSGMARAHHGARDFGRVPFAPYGGAAVRASCA